MLDHPMANDIPENCRLMLTAMLPTSLCVPSDERHPHQAMVVDMVGDVTGEIISRMKTGIDTAAARVAEIEKSKPELDLQKSQAEESLEVALSELQTKKTVSTDVSVQLAEGKTLLSEKQQALKASEAPVRPIRKEKENLETMLSTDFKALRNLEEWEAGKVKKRCNSIVSVAKKLSFDESLTSALSGSLSKKPDERTQFDILVLQQFEVGVLEKVKKLAEILETGSISIDQCVFGVGEAQSEFEKRKVLSDTAVAHLQAAQGEHRKAIADLQVATGAVGNYESELKRAQDVHDAKTEELRNFQEWNVFCYKSLKDRVSAKRSKELAEVVEQTPQVAEPADAMEAKADLAEVAEQTPQVAESSDAMEAKADLAEVVEKTPQVAESSNAMEAEADVSTAVTTLEVSELAQHEENTPEAVAEGVVDQ